MNRFARTRHGAINQAIYEGTGSEQIELCERTCLVSGRHNVAERPGALQERQPLS
jgi:hypothetical protein